MIPPNKLFEYLAAGRPVIARNTHRIRRFYEKYPAGFLFNTVKDIFEHEIHKVEDLYFSLLES